MPKIKYLIDEESKNRKEVTDKLKELKDIQLIEEDEKTKLRSPKHERDKELTLLEEIRQIYVTLVKTTQEKQKIGSIYEEKQVSLKTILIFY
jgi:hypothetical protein